MIVLLPFLVYNVLLMVMLLEVVEAVDAAISDESTHRMLAGNMLVLEQAE